jgi:hypothetical protein
MKIVRTVLEKVAISLYMGSLQGTPFLDWDVLIHQALTYDA